MNFDESEGWGTKAVPDPQLQPNFLPPLTYSEMLASSWDASILESFDICSNSARYHNTLLFVLTLGCIPNEKAQCVFVFAFFICISVTQHHLDK